MNPSGDSRKVGQLRNDVDDIYEMLGVINGTLAEHTTTLAEHSALHAQHTARFDELDIKLDRVLEILEAS